MASPDLQSQTDETNGNGHVRSSDESISAFAESVIDQCLRITSSAENPEDEIALFINYIGAVLQSDRVMIFERMVDGTYSNTYEWCAPGVKRLQDEMVSLPAEMLHYGFTRCADGNFVIADIEEVRNHSSIGYALLKKRGVHSAISMPLLEDGWGLFGVDNPHAESINDVESMLCIFKEWAEIILRRRNLMRKIRLELDHNNRIFRASGMVTFTVDAKTRELDVSDFFEEYYGWAFPFKTLEEMLDFVGSHPLFDRDSFNEAQQKLREDSQPMHVEIPCYDKEMRTRWVRLTAIPFITETGSIPYYFGVGREVTQDHENANRATALLAMELEEERERSKTDSLSGLLNRAAMDEDATRMLNMSGCHNCALIFIDLDHFKALNDTLGHAEGDRAIHRAASAVRATFRSTDLMGRMGGDEYCILLNNIPYELVEAKLARLKSVLSWDHSSPDGSIPITASIGCVYYTNPDVAYPEMLAAADKAMYEAKRNGRNRFVIHKMN